MLARSLDRFRRLSPPLRLFLLGTFCLGAVSGIFETTFNNYLHDTFDIGADARGFLEFPRELPGFLTVVMAGALVMLPETWIAAAAALVIGVGMIGLSVWGAGWGPMLAFMVLWSVGAHLIMPVSASVGMELAESAHRKGRRLGQIQAVGIAAAIAGCAIVWLGMRLAIARYDLLFLIGGVVALAAAGCFAAMRMPGAHLERPRFVWHREYWLYYVLAFLFGARKQIFLTFGPWVLVKLFGQPAWVFAQLWIAAAVLGIVFQPALGRAIDHFGERAVLMADAVAVLLVCLGYACAHLIPLRAAALGLLFVCYVGDQLLFGANMARNTYLSKIAVRPEHVSPTLSLGVTINHLVSMSIPTVGGLLWIRYGHATVFLGAAGIAVLMLIFTSMIRIPDRSPSEIPTFTDGRDTASMLEVDPRNEGVD